MCIEKRKRILKYLRDETQPNFSVNLFVLGRLEIFALSIAAALFGLIAVFGVMELDIIYIQLAVIGITIAMLVPILSNMVRELKSLKGPTDMLLESSFDRMTDQDKIVEQLTDESLADLTRVRDHLEFEVRGLATRTILLAGSLGKLGPIPAIILIYTSYYFKLEEFLPQRILLAILALTIATYMLGVASALVNERANRMIYVADLAVRTIEEKTDNS